MENLNPFTERGVIRDPKRFFGRKRELDQIFQRLAAMQSVSIVGERRIGKSSLLAMIAAGGVDRLEGDYRIHYIDLQLVESAEDFFARLMDALGIKGETTRDLERAIEKHKVVVCLDEFERSEDFSKDFFNVLRGLALTGHLALVTASQRRLADLASDGTTTSPFFNIFTSIWLGAMSEAEAGEVLNGLGRLVERTFAPGEIRAAYQETGGNPWKLQIFGEQLYGANDLAEATRRYRQILAGYNGTPIQIERPAPQSSKNQIERIPSRPRKILIERIAGLLLILSAVIGFVAMLAGSAAGIVLTAVLAVSGLILEAAMLFTGQRSA